MNGRLSCFGILYAVLATMALLACSGAEPTPTATPTPAATPTPSPTPTATSTPASTSTPTLTAANNVPSSDEVRVQVISSELSVGANRLVFALLDRDLMPVQEVQAELSTFYPEGSSLGEPNQVVRVSFRKWPLGALGVYTAAVDFHRAGIWGFKVEVAGAGGATRTAEGRFEVTEESTTPGIGSAAPLSRNKTSRDVSRLEELTSAREPDPDLYSMTIADAISSGKPLVVVFATPLLCRTSTCGPQVDVIEDVKARYQDRVNFIHVEIFDNPHEIEGDFSNARSTPAVEEWGLVTEPWTFLVDVQGRIAAKFEAFTTQEELEEHLDLLLLE